MRILHICNGYYDTKLYNLLIKNLEKLKVKNTIFVFLNKNSKVDKTEEKVSNVKIFNNIERIFYYWKQYKVFKVCENLYKPFDNVNLTHAHTTFSNGDIAYRIKKKWNIPYIVAVRNTDINVFFKYIFFLRKRGIRILKESEKIIFLSPVYQKNFIEKYVPKNLKDIFEKKSIIIPNGIDEFWLKNQFLKNEFNSKKYIKLIYVGNVDKNKNISTTIKACKLLINRGYCVKFTIIGKLFLNKGILNESFINYIPWIKKEDLIKYYRENDIFIMPSKYETFGLVYAEALSQSLPIIYSKDQGFDGQIPEGKVGYSVIYNDELEIANKIEKIFKNQKNYLKNIPNQLNKFNWENIAKEYKFIYSKILD